MAQVANCPQCKCELLIAEGTDPSAWARCAECRAFFQVKNAPAREIRAALMVGSESTASNVETLFTGDATVDPAPSPSQLTLSGASLGTISEFQAPVTGASTNGAHSNPKPEVLSTESIDLEVVDEGKSPPVNAADASELDATSAIGSRPTERMSHDLGKLTGMRPPALDHPEETADRVDKWFRSEKARIDSTRSAESDATPEYSPTSAAGLDYDIDRGSDATLPDDRATWDDSEHMDRLLADVERTLDEQDKLEAMEDADESDRSEPKLKSFRQQSVEIPPAVFNPPGRLPRRRPSAIRMLTGIVVSGVVGLSLGYIALLWIAGSSADFLNIAQHLPSAILPAELRTAIVDRTDADDRGEIQAVHTEPVERIDAAGSSADRGTEIASDTLPRDGGEPLPFDADAARPIDDAPTAAAGSLISPPSFTPDELAVALRTAEEAQPGLVAGDFKDGREVQRAKGLSYSLLCDLAQKCVFVDAASRGEYADSLATKGKELFQQTLADRQTRDEVAVIVRKWIDSPHRKHGGVFFSGTVEREADKGSVTECQVDIGGGQMLTILVPPAAARQLSESPHPLGVVGWIVDKPADQVSGYTGDARQAIWAGHLIPLQ